MAAAAPPREALQQPTELADPEPRTWIQRPPRPAPTPTPDDQDQAEQYARALKRARRGNYPKVTKEEVLEASLYKHAVKSRMLEGMSFSNCIDCEHRFNLNHYIFCLADADAGAPQWAVTLQAAVTTLQGTVTALQGTVTTLQATVTTHQATTTTSLAALALGQAAATARYGNPRMLI
jgi:hypothetical protein